MLLPKVLLFTLTFCKVLVYLDATLCKKGEHVTRERRCDACAYGYYQSEENESQDCKPCTRCSEDYGSSVKEECKKESNRICHCRPGFVPWEDDASTCKCKEGFELIKGECLECKNGYFSISDASPCKKWKECKSGVKSNGSQTSDVICNDEKTNHDTTTTILIQLTSLRQLKEAQTQATHTLTTPRATPQHKGTTEKNGDSTNPPNTGNYIGMALLIFGIVGLLVLTAVTCKLHITFCMQKKTAVQKKDSCRRPVEESGDGSLSSLKLNP